MVDFKKISQEIRTNVEKIMSQEGDAKKIDSKKELNQIGNLLAGATGKNEKEYYQSLIDGYYSVNTDAVEVSANLKKTLRNLAKLDKGSDTAKIDSEVEASAIAALLNDARLNDAEKEFIQGLLKRSGFEHLLPDNNVTAEPKEENTLPTENTQYDPVPETTPEPKAEEPHKEPNENNETLPNKPEPAPYPNPTPNPEPKPQVNTTVLNSNNNNNNTSTTTQNGKVNIIGNNTTVIIESDGKVRENSEGSETEELSQKGKMTKEQLEAMANQIFDAIDGFGTKDEQLKNALNDITKDNIMELLETYNAKHPDMFAGVLDDLSGRDYTFAVRIFKEALVDRARDIGIGDNVKADEQAIEDELTTKHRSDEKIAGSLNNIASKIRRHEINS